MSCYFVPDPETQYIAAPPCEFCQRTEGQHNGDCPAVLKTAEQRIERAAHIFGSFDAWRARQICTENGVSELEMAKGIERCEARRREREIRYATKGHPMYGGGHWS